MAKLRLWIMAPASSFRDDVMKAAMLDCGLNHKYGMDGLDEETTQRVNVKYEEYWKLLNEWINTDHDYLEFEIDTETGACKAVKVEILT